MQRSPFRFTIRTTMLLVLIAAIISALAVLVQRTVGPLLMGDRGLNLTAWRYPVVVGILTTLLAIPFTLAAVLQFGSPAQPPSRHKRTIRLGLAAISLIIGLAILDFPLDGSRQSRQLKDGSYVNFYHQYRFWPGQHITPCLEVTSPTGKPARSYPIARNVYYHGFPALRTSADESLIWFMDDDEMRGPKHGGIWCVLNRTTGEFIPASGPFPPEINKTAGFKPSDDRP